MVESGEAHWVLDVVKGEIVIMSYMTSLPWLIHIVSSLPVVAQGVVKYKDWAAASIRHRIQNKPPKANTMGQLLQDTSEKSSVETDWNELVGDIMAMVTGGNGTCHYRDPVPFLSSR